MARYFTDFEGLPVGDITTSGQTDWTPKVSNGSYDYRILDIGGTDGKVLKIQTIGAYGTRLVAYNALNGVSDNIETLVKFSIFKSSSDGSTGRYGSAYTRYGGTSEATTIGYSASFTPVSSTKNIVLNEDSTGMVQYTPFAWSMSTDYFIRTRISGSNTYVKVWAASGAEPGTWTLSNTSTPPTIALPYSGVGTYAADSYLYVTQYSAATNGDTAPITKAEYDQWVIDTLNNSVPASTPIVGYGGGIGSVSGYGRGYGEVILPAQSNTILVVDNTLHTNTVINIDLTQVHSILISNALHSVIDNSTFITSAQSILVDNAAHAHTTTSVILQETYLLLTNNVSHSLSSDNISLITGFALLVNSVAHSLTSDNINLSQAQTVLIDNSLHTNIITSPLLIEAKLLIIDSALHAINDSIGLFSITHILSIDNDLHTVSSESPLIVQAAIIAINNSLHSLTSTSFDIIQFTLLNKPEDVIHTLTSQLSNLSQEHKLILENALHKLRSDEIEKIFDWTDMNVDFGNYVKNWVANGTLSQDEINSGRYTMNNSGRGSLETDEINTGTFTKNNIQKGKF